MGPTMLLRSFLLLAAITAMPLGGGVSPALGQDVKHERTSTGYRVTQLLPGGGRSTYELPSARQALADFEQKASKGRQHYVRGGSAVDEYLVHFERFPKAAVDSVLTGLERIALTADNANARIAAATSLSALGDPRFKKAIPGSLIRSLRVYRQSRDPLVRSLILPRLAFYEDRPQVIAFLKNVAMQSPSEEDFPDAPAHAVGALTDMTEDGQAALKWLYESKRVRNVQAAASLHYLSKRGFREEGH